MLRWLTNYHADRSWRWAWNAARSYWPLMHTLFMGYCASTSSGYYFLSRRIWLVYSWQFYSICAVQNERINWRELEEIIIRDFRNLFWTGLSNGRKLMREINVKSIFSYSNMWTKVKLKFISNRSSRKN